MNDKTENQFEAFQPRSTDTAQMDIDGIGSAVTAITSMIGKLHPEQASMFSQISEQLGKHLTRLRENRNNAYDYFLGKGPVARKLREHLAADNWLNPQNKAKNADILRQLDMGFNKFPTKDEMELRELVDFVQLTMPLMAGHIDGREFLDYDPNKAITSLPSGFYKYQGPMLPVYMLLLNTKLSPSGVGVVYALKSGQEEQLFFNHPEEGEWFRADGSFTFAGLASKLRAELDLVIEPLGLSALKTELGPKLDEVFTKVDYIFDQYHRLPTTGVQCLRHEPGQTSINVPVGDYYRWSFVDTRGDWPTRNKRFVILLGGAEQSANPDVLNEFSRQNMLKSLHVVLDNIIGALVPETAAAS
jgi:hypothetical protein